MKDLIQEGHTSCNLQNQTSSIFKNCSLLFCCCCFCNNFGFFFHYYLERIAFLYQTYLACKIICQLHHVFSGHTSKTSLDATCLITHLMPILILLECARNRTKNNWMYSILRKKKKKKRNSVEEAEQALTRTRLVIPPYKYPRTVVDQYILID